MDIASYMANRKRPMYREDWVVLASVERESPLSDPERPAYVDSKHTAASLLGHLERSLLDGREPVANPAWHELASLAANVRNRQDSRESEQGVRRNRYSRSDGTDIELGDAELERIVEADVKRRTFFATLDRMVPASERPAVHAAIEANVMKQAFVAGERGVGPEIDVPGFDLAWGGREGKAFQSAMMKLSAAAKADAKERNVGIDFENNDRPDDQLEARVDPRETMKRWISGMTPVVGREHVGVGEFYDVVMPSEEEAVVMKGFLDIALKAHDAGRTPTLAELSADVGALRDTLSTPQYVLKSERVRVVEDGPRRSFRPQARDIDAVDGEPRGERRAPAVATAGGSETWRSAIKAVVVRQAIVDRNAGYKKTDGLGRISQAEADFVAASRSGDRDAAEVEALRLASMPSRENVLSALEQRTRIVGIEGQRHYQGQDAIERELRTLTANRRASPMMVSHAPEGSAFREALVAAAAKAGIPVVRTELQLRRVTVNTDIGETIKNFDGDYAAPMYTRKELRATCTVDVRFGEGESWQKADLTSATARAGTAGKLVLVDVRSMGPEGDADKRLFQAMVNHAALTPNEMVGFGIERHDKAFGRIVSRREMSGMEPARVFDKAGNAVAHAAVLEAVGPAGKTARQERAETTKASTADLSLAQPTGQAIALGMIGAKRAGDLTASFRTIGEAQDVGERVLAAPKKAAEIAAALGMPMDALRAAAAWASSTRDAERLGRVTATARDALRVASDPNVGNDILANPRDPMVAAYGPLVGFSSLRDPSGNRRDDTRTIAIVGEPAPASEALRRNVAAAVGELADRYGRDARGVAKVRLLTTFTQGTGEAVMEAALAAKVPLEVIGHKDDRFFKKGTPELKMFETAVALQDAGLGGTWSAARYDRNVPPPVPETAARIAMNAADATIVAAAAARSPLTLTIAAAAQTKPVLVMPASDADRRAYGGNQLLTAKDATIGAAFDRSGGQVGRVLENTTFAPLRGEASSGRIYASVDTKAGAPRLQSPTDMMSVVAAAEGRIDATMSRRRPNADMGMAEANRLGARLDVIGGIDLDRLGEKGYRGALDLTPAEARMTLGMRLQYVQDSALVGRREFEGLERKFATRPREQERNAGYGR